MYKPMYDSLEDELAAAQREASRLDQERVEAILDWEKASAEVARILMLIAGRDYKPQRTKP